MRKKTILLLSALCLLGTTSLAQKELKTDIEAVTVYLDGAMITRTKSVSLPAGETQLLFTGLSSRLESRSVQLEASAPIQILSVTDKNNFEKTQTQSKRVKVLKDSVEQLSDQMIEINDQIDALEMEKELLTSNQSIGGQQTGVSIDQLKAAADFYRQRVLDINTKITTQKIKSRRTNEVLAKKSQQLNELNGNRAASTKEVMVLVKAKSAVTTTITLKYLVSSAGWVANYDIRAKDITEPVNLVYRAKVFNNSNTDWKNVKLRLSTADPRRSASKPELTAWRFDRRNNYGNVSGYKSYDNRYANADAPLQQAQTQSGLRADGIVYEEIDIPELSSEFDIKEQYNIPSDAKPYMVEVTEYQLDATFKHFAIPKMERVAFLLARITGWEDLNLVEGNANVYYGGAYIGQSYLKTAGTNDTLDLSLGRDNQVVIARKTLRDFTKTKVIGNVQKDILSFEVKIKNNRKAPISIEIQDQVPISGDNSITIDKIELSDAEEDESNGLLTWNYKIEPGQSKSHVLTFSIKHPKNMSVATKRNYKATRAKF